MNQGFHNNGNLNTIILNLCPIYSKKNTTNSQFNKTNAIQYIIDSLSEI